MKRLYTFVIFIVIFGSWLNLASAQNVEFPDANLAKKMREALNLPAGAAIPKARLATLTSLHASKNQISDLTGLEHATQLTVLHLLGNQISDITPLTGLTQLTTVYLSFNEISDISPLAGLTQLSTLMLRSTGISDIRPLTGLTQLRTLQIEDNALRDISSLTGLTKLENLYSNSNEISDLSPLAGLTRLTRLFLSSNLISDVSPLVGLINLELLELEDNAISDISPLDGLVENTYIAWTNNPGFPTGGPKITGPWLWSMVPGTRLDGSTDFLSRASGGETTELEIATNGAEEGTAVGNSVWTLHWIAPTGWDNINQLVAVLGWGTREAIYDHIVYGSFVFNAPHQQQTNMFVGSSDAVKVWLNGELVHQALVGRLADDYQWFFPVTLKQGKNILLVAVDNHRRGPFSGFFGFAPEAEYTTPLTDEMKVEFPDGNLAKKVREVLGLPADADIPKGLLATLTTLDVSASWETPSEEKIRDLTGLEHAIQLTTLALKQNAISDIGPLAGLTQLSVLYLEGNNVSDLTPLIGLTQLSTLDLQGNSINDLTPLAGLTQLETLILSHNSISDVSPLVGLTQLRYLYLDDNWITDISPLISLTQLSGSTDRPGLSLRHNPLRHASIHTHIPTLQAAGVNVRYVLTQPKPIVRIIYFLPRDRQSQPDINTQMDGVIKKVQTFYADQMQRHGFGSKTFAYETDATGKAVVHHVPGKFNDAYYQDNLLTKVIGEIGEHLNTSNDIYLVALDSDQKQHCGVASGRFVFLRSPGLCVRPWVAAHELGHVFGLNHDFRDVYHIMHRSQPGLSSFEENKITLSKCSAEWLDVHRAFTPNSNPGGRAKIKMLPPSLTDLPHASRLHFEVVAPHGLHQAQLFSGFGGNNLNLLACKLLDGNPSNTIEFVTTGLTLKDDWVTLNVIDVNGNITGARFRIRQPLPIGEDAIVLKEHTDWVRSVAFSPDGQTLASASDDETVRLWDVSSGQLKTTLKGHTDTVTSVAYSPDGTTLASGGIDETVRLWNVDSGQLKITLKGHSKTVWDVAFSPDGTTLASGGIDETVRLWNVDSGQLKAILKGHTDIITSVVFSPDGTTLASGGLDETVRLWDVSSGQLKITLKGHTDTVTSVAYSPDGTTLASGGIDETIRLWDVGSGQLSETLTGHVDEVRSIVFSPDGTTLASGGLDCTVKLWDATIGQHEATRRGHADGVMSVAYSPDGTMLASGGLDNTVILIPVSAVNINAYVQVGASERPPMYWVDTTFGTLHHLTGEKVEKLVADIQNVTDLAVDVADGKVYWTQKTSDRTGKVQRANLDGTDVQLVKDLTSVPHGIVLDTASSKIYLTNSWDKVQRMNLDGTNFQPNLITSLSSPKDIAVDVAGGKIYWTEEDRIRRANLNGSNIQTVATNLGTLGGIAIANGKIYWTEKTDENSGKIQAANLSGAINIEEIATFTTSVPLGVAVDTKEHKLYWTNSNRRIQRSNLSGEDIQGVASGLGAPAAIVLGTEPIAPVVAAAPTTAVASPDTTALLPNYPNPFNPETWIPYQLAKPADVTLTIYAVNGQIVRRLALGHQLVGTYQSKNRAAYWDGRNTVGEPVASGLYFYTFTAGDFTATRKMLIRK